MQHEDDLNLVRKYDRTFMSIAEEIFPGCETQIASDAQDWREATDMNIKLPDGRVIPAALRMREHHYLARHYRFRFTTRLSRPSGAQTELSKIMDGHADLYFVGWTGPALVRSESGRLITNPIETRSKLHFWEVYDLCIFRDHSACALFEDRPNKDGRSDLRAWAPDSFPREFVVDGNVTREFVIDGNVK